LAVGLKDEIFSVGSPLPAALVWRIVPAGEEAVQVGSGGGDFPDHLLAKGSGGFGGVEAKEVAIGRPGDILNVAGVGEEFSRSRSI
jgi:hypothetical protein